MKKFNIKEWISEHLYLIIFSIVCIFLAWAYFKITGEAAFDILTFILVVILFVENRKLKKSVEELIGSKEESTESHEESDV